MSLLGEERTPVRCSEGLAAAQPEASGGGGVGRGAQSVLHRSDDEVTAQIHARKLHRGHAYTAWFVIFNEPIILINKFN